MSTSSFLPFERGLLRFLTAFLMTTFGSSLQAQTASSQRLADTIQSNGRGTINLMMGTGNTPLSAAQLETLRLEHFDASSGTPRYYLSLGVDVNENNKGLETSTSQGVSIASVSLTVQWPGITRTYTSYRSATQALIMPAGSSSRQRYYTLLGEGGSSRITGSNAIQNQYDSTLDIFVPDSLAGALSATLSIQLLDTNKNKPVAEPESFYDYSGGFEDLALLNRDDAYYLNAVLPTTSTFQVSAPTAEIVNNSGSSDTAASPGSSSTELVAWSYFPSATGWYHVAYEDNYPDRGDYDFNDAVVAYRYKLGLNASGQVLRVEAESYLLADGASYVYDWQFRLPLPGTGSVTCTVRRAGDAQGLSCSGGLAGNWLQATPYVNVDKAGSWFSAPGADAYVNVLCGSSQASRNGPHMRLTATLDQPQAQSSVGTPVPALLVPSKGTAITSELRDSRGYPYALLVPTGWAHACEGVDLGVAYPQLVTFLSSGGSQGQTWYLSPSAGQVAGLPGAWEWDP
ncbi:LruC domain-containing protein [Mitsuaria sp. WAJ17]|uniref:LruC domain-containing protein n=1 Tax=Mitsuaria sp. WAJ17 TaxID=2761452 RepID=UPI001603824A|nr:LruC domain-containing protein [Mitsuaria sp. WAJ17]MBB2487053.1 LruC domain-containing protein [Mitsuaria sp. WAJ17]